MSARERIRAFLLENFYVTDPTDLADDTHLITSGIVDSTGMLEVITFLEREYGVQVEDRETTPENLATVERLDAFVARKLAAAEGSSR